VREFETTKSAASQTKEKNKKEAKKGKKRKKMPPGVPNLDTGWDRICWLQGLSFLFIEKHDKTNVGH
jgi:hypothetical protein